MANAEQILSLIKSHFNEEKEKFITHAIQIAAYEAKLGHIILANELNHYALKVHRLVQ